MGEEYKIGDISKLMNIPVQTLRFYEEKNIISPKKNESTGYRYYNAWNINDLMDTMILRESDFSLQQVAEILNTNNLEDMTREFMDQEAHLLEKIELYKTKLEAVSAQRLRIQNFRHQIGTFTKCASPGLIYHRHRKNNQYISRTENNDIKELAEELAPWIAAFPSALPTFYIPFYELNRKDRDHASYWWGLSITSDDAWKYQLKAAAPNEYIPSSKSIYAVFEAGEEGTFLSSFYEQVYDRLLQEGYLVNGSVFGRLIIKTHESDGYKRYFEAWIPVS